MAQSNLNLIPNPSFEDINICHKYTEPCSPKAWRSVILKNIRYIAHEADQKHFFPAADGERCIAFGMFNERKKQDRSFVQVPLLATLEAGRKYKLSFAFRPEQVMIQSFGVYFADTLIVHDDTKALLQYSPQVVFDFPKKLSPATWHTVEAIYTAKGNEQGLMIGNFNVDKNTDATLIGKRPKGYVSRRVYYAFDNFKLQAIDGQKIQADLVVSKDFIYQDSFRHINKFGIPVVSMISTTDSLNFYRRPTPPPIHKKPDKVFIANTEIRVNEAFVASAINFANNSDQLLESASPTLEVVADFLIKNNTFKLKVIGYTDDVGQPFFNQKLSEDRARAVVRFLINKGVNPQQLIAIGRGEQDPVADNYSAYGRQQNRRVEFIFY
ncbi:MAG: OmpA family protein [Saprospiraceae bacterium]